MPLDRKKREKLLTSSKAVAAALLQDLQHFRDLLNRDTLSQRDVRTTGTTLRRLLVERDLPIVAHPRIGKISYLAPDNQPFYDAAKDKPYELAIRKHQVWATRAR